MISGGKGKTKFCFWHLNSASFTNVICIFQRVYYNRIPLVVIFQVLYIIHIEYSFKDHNWILSPITYI